MPLLAQGGFIMQEQELLNNIAALRAELDSLRPNKKRTRSKDYVVDYSALTQVYNGYVHPSILALVSN